MKEINVSIEYNNVLKVKNAKRSFGRRIVFAGELIERNTSPNNCHAINEYAPINAGEYKIGIQILRKTKIKTIKGVIARNTNLRVSLRTFDCAVRSSKIDDNFGKPYCQIAEKIMPK